MDNEVEPISEMLEPVEVSLESSHFGEDCSFESNEEGIEVDCYDCGSGFFSFIDLIELLPEVSEQVDERIHDELKNDVPKTD